MIKMILTIFAYFFNPERYIDLKKRRLENRIERLRYERNKALENNDSDALTRIHADIERLSKK